MTLALENRTGQKHELHLHGEDLGADPFDLQVLQHLWVQKCNVEEADKVSQGRRGFPRAACEGVLHGSRDVRDHTFMARGAGSGKCRQQVAGEYCEPGTYYGCD